MRQGEREPFFLAIEDADRRNQNEEEGEVRDEIDPGMRETEREIVSWQGGVFFCCKRNHRAPSRKR